MKRFIPIIVLLVLMQCCSREPGSRPEIERDKLVDMLIDIHMTDAYLSYQGRFGKWPKHDDAENAYGFILEKYDVTPAQFMNTMKYYGRHIKEYEQIYNKVIERLTKYQTENDEASSDNNQPKPKT
ncbi:MAG: DUF4296 domain-containing protein [Salinivirgaceae bacterium]|nr:DUF4296 domain-containing protein [Salinivirgaceae bacterium]